MITKLPFGLRQGKLVSIEDVEKGLACNCICPSCKSTLIARKGDFRVHHFAHYKGESCEHGIETALHLAAKDIIEQKKIFVIPPLTVSGKQVDYKTIKLSDSKRLNIDNVQLESYLGNFKPDIIATIRNKSLIIEIAVTHFVDELKYEKIKARGISCVEINLKSLKDGFSKKELIESVIESIDNKTWIFNAEKQKRLSKFLQEQKNQLLKEEAERKETAIAIKRRKDYAKKNGFDILKPYQYSDEYLCPMLIQKYASKMRNNYVTEELRSGKLWNGTIYGKGSNGKYIFIDGVKTEVFPVDSNNKLKEHEYQLRKNIYRQLVVINKKTKVPFEECEECKYFVEYIDNSIFSLSCRFRKDNKLK